MVLAVMQTTRHTPAMQRSSRSHGASGVLLAVWQLVLLLVVLPYQPVIVTAVINTQRTVGLRSLEAGNGDNPLGTIDGLQWNDNFELQGEIWPTMLCHRTKRELPSSVVMSSGSASDTDKLAADRRRQHHRDRLLIRYDMDGTTMTLDLRLSENIIAQQFKLVRQSAEGEDIVLQNDGDDDSGRPQEVELCQYGGTVPEMPGSRVALSTCDGRIEGVIYGTNETYLIQYNNATHLLYRRRRRSVHHAALEEMDSIPTRHPSATTGKEKFAFSTGYRENAESLFVELAMVVDRSTFLKFSSNEQRIHRHCLSVVNVLNELYRPLNIYIVLVGVEVWNQRDRIELSRDSKQTLANFLAYRRDTLLRTMPNDNAQLLTAVRFPNNVVGKAELGSMCSSTGSGGIAVVEHFDVAPLATTIAHELGHNFNIDHDTVEECGGEAACPGPGPCIMAPKLLDSADVPSVWSKCSLADLKESLEHGLGACLRNKPTRQQVRAECGNGLLEPGEQCDCGRPGQCNNACCDPSTCRLRGNATCATGACCDLGTCQPRMAGTECRRAGGECDLAEYCDGQSELCPADVYLRDTSPCAGGHAYCYRGQCNSRDRQCQLLWGPTGRSGPNECYQANVNGTVFGNCGTDLLANRSVPCPGHDVQCGLLHCTHQNEKLEYGKEAYAQRTTTRYSSWGPRGTTRHVTCNTAIVDFGPEVRNPGLVPDGAECGKGKMCHGQRCVAISALRELDIGEECPGGCGGHGVCNSEGHCHCEPGFAPPFCDQPGAGGSIDSGPIGRTPTVSHEALVQGLIIGGTIGGMLIVSVLVFVLARNFLMAQVRLALKRFRERKYGHIVPPASPTGLSAPPAIYPTTVDGKRPLASGRLAPPAPPPPPPPPPMPSTALLLVAASSTVTSPADPQAQSQSFINVNISKNGKITIENKRINSPFLHQQHVLDTQEAFRMKLQERSYSVESNVSSERPLVTAELHSSTPDVAHSPVEQPGYGTVLHELKQTDRINTFHSNRSKSDERPARQLPKLPRQHTFGDFDTIERLPEEEQQPHPKKGPLPTKPIAIPRPSPRVAVSPGHANRLLPTVPTTNAVGGRPVMGTNVAALKAKLNLAEIATKR
ncbi:disintegrin and metalloproteinase domain-containing protein 12-like [Anopheles darlingi]|uniref:disintegrin and metalloproteinase domain-containing protein 12-like n=1 Tax=Anopheles darlingi TaxID=43151 RepID=UPI00210054BA|nr:disintegrin and metalloproteinase domain-containing protein 12-like [Anopheles darlingi]